MSWLETVYLVHSLPPWSRNLNNRTAGTRKWYGADTGVIAGLLNRATAALLQPTEPLIGALFETFVVNEIRRQLSWSQTPTSLFHYRDRDGTEVDLVLETDDGRVAAIEIKASGSPSGADHRGLEDLRDRVTEAGGEFVFGLLLHAGPHHLRLGDRIGSAPIESIWAVV